MDPRLTRRGFLGGLAALPLTGRGRVASYDLVIRGGRVIDPAAGVDRVADVAIAGGRIAAIVSRIPGTDAVPTIEASGRIVAPGLIDIHVHLDSPELTPESLLADGVTAAVDGGSRGADNIEPLVEIARRAPNHVRLLVNVARTGITADGELHDLQNADVAAARAAIARHRDVIVGVKARLSRGVAGPNDVEAVRRARAAAGPLPVMLHIGQTLSPLPEILRLLNPGDIVTHMYAPPPNSIVDADGQLLPAVLDARRRGIRFDVGNGRGGHITWPIAERAIADGFHPDTISSDLTAPGRTFRVFDLPTVLSKFLLLGLPLPEVIACATAHAARAFAPLADLGGLRVGAVADLAVLELRHGDFSFVDNQDVVRKGDRKLFATATVLGGRSVRRPSA